MMPLISCSQQYGSEEASTRQEPSIELGQEFTVDYGQQVRLAGEGLEVRFASVASDSRCPSDPEVRCVWEGYAQIVVWLSKDDEKSAAVRLNTPNALQQKYPSEKNYLDYTVELIALSPYPKTAGGIRPAEYVATLVITI
jgi:hypothetical protein